MFAAKRRFEPSVIQQALESPHQFSFFQWMRVFAIWLRQNNQTENAQRLELVRFGNSLSLSFPASELEAIRTVPAEIPLTEEALRRAIEEHRLEFLELTPVFMGLLGTNGALPAHYTERLAAHLSHTRDFGPKAFLDLFSNRSLQLFFAAWGKYRLGIQHEIHNDGRLLGLLKTFAGIGQSALSNRLVNNDEGVLDDTVAFYATAFRHRPVSLAMLHQVLSDYFSVPISFTPFQGKWYSVPSVQQTSLGGDSAVLGGGALVGERVWQRDACMVVEIGPLNWTQFQSFLPGKTAAIALEKLLTLFTGVAIEYEVKLRLRKEDIQSACLHTLGMPVQLGWNSFVFTSPLNEDRQDVSYALHSMRQHA